MKILIAVDGSAYTKRMLAYLAAHDEWFGAQHAYTVLTVVPPIPSRAAVALPEAVLRAHYDDEAARVLRPIRSFLAKHGLATEFVSETGAAADTIATLAKKGQFDLLMMGSHGHGAMGSLVLGSVSTKVIAHCATPVLIIR